MALQLVAMPQEIVVHILAHLDPPNLKPMLTLSKALYPAALRSLYTEIELCSPEGIEAVECALLDHPEKALLVRTLDLSL